MSDYDRIAELRKMNEKDDLYGFKALPLGRPSKDEMLFDLLRLMLKSLINIENHLKSIEHYEEMSVG